MSEVSRTCHAGQKLAIWQHGMHLVPSSERFSCILQIRIPTPYLVGAAAGFVGGWLARGCKWLRIPFALADITSCRQSSQAPTSCTAALSIGKRFVIVGGAVAAGTVLNKALH